MNPPSRIREFRHLFAGPRRITATIRVDLAELRYRPGVMIWARCVWRGSKIKQPSAELWPEFKEWSDFVFSDVAAKTGTNLLYAFDLPAPARRIEVWLHKSNCDPRLVRAWPNPFQRPLSEILAGLPPENWGGDACH